MTDYEKEEFSKALGRLYDTTVELRATTVELRASTADLRATSEQLVATAKQDGENIRALARIADLHDRRFSRLEQIEEQKH
jgi:hypothetical protein